MIEIKRYNTVFALTIVGKMMIDVFNVLTFGIAITQAQFILVYKV